MNGLFTKYIRENPRQSRSHVQKPKARNESYMKGKTQTCWIEMWSQREITVTRWEGR